MDRPTTLAMMRALERRDIQKSKSPKGSIFVQEVLPFMSALGGPAVGLLASKKVPGWRAVALGGGTAAAGTLPSVLADARRARELRPALQNAQQRRDLRNLELASLAGLGSTVLGGAAGGIRNTPLRSRVNTASLALFAPAVGVLLYQHLKDKNSRVAQPTTNNSKAT